MTNDEKKEVVRVVMDCDAIITEFKETGFGLTDESFRIESSRVIRIVVENLDWLKQFLIIGTK